MNVQVLDRRWAIAEARFRASGHYLFAPLLGLLAGVPDLDDPNLAVLTDSSHMECTTGRRRIRHPEPLSHSVVFVRRDSCLDDPYGCHERPPRLTRETLLLAGATGDAGRVERQWPFRSSFACRATATG